jgi:hypothetical protein
VKKFICTIPCSFFLILPVISQSLKQPVSAIYIGLSAYSTKQQDVFSYLNNQAVLANTKNTAAGIYSERRFLLSATSLYTAAIAIPTTKGNFGVNLKYSGFKNFNESQAGVAYSRDLGKKAAAGIQCNY